MRQDGRVSFYADPGYAVPVSMGEPDRQRRRVLVAVGVAIVVSLFGLGVGLLWRVLAPHVQIIKVEQGFLYADSQPEQAVAADGWFAFLGLAAGVLVAIGAWIAARRHRGLWVLVGLVVGSLVGAWLGWRLGVWLEMRHFEALVTTAPVGAQIEAPLSLRITDLDRMHLWPPRATGVVAAQALAAAATYTTLAGFAADPQLRPDAPVLAEAGPIDPLSGDFIRPLPGQAAWPPLAQPAWPGSPAGSAAQASPELPAGSAAQASPELPADSAAQASPEWPADSAPQASPEWPADSAPQASPELAWPHRAGGNPETSSGPGGPSGPPGLPARP